MSKLRAVPRVPFASIVRRIYFLRQAPDMLTADGELSEVVQARLDRELGVINKLGFANYFRQARNGHAFGCGAKGVSASSRLYQPSIPKGKPSLGVHVLTADWGKGRNGLSAEERWEKEPVSEVGEQILAAFPELKYIAFSFLKEDEVEKFGQQLLSVQKVIHRTG